MGAQAPIINLEPLFGAWKPLKSLTAWGLVLYAGADSIATEMCANGLVSVAVCGTIAGLLEKAGVVLAAMGIRRRLPGSAPAEVK